MANTIDKVSTRPTTAQISTHNSPFQTPYKTPPPSQFINARAPSNFDNQPSTSFSKASTSSNFDRDFYCVEEEIVEKFDDYSNDDADKAQMEKNKNKVLTIRKQTNRLVYF